MSRMPTALNSRGIANSRKIRVQAPVSVTGGKKSLSHGGAYMHFAVMALYGGPDQVMTVTSGIASIIGVLLIFWHKVVNAFFKLFGLKRKPLPPDTAPDSSSKTPSQAE